MRFRRNLMGVTALAVSLGLDRSACGSDSGSSSDTTAAVRRSDDRAAARPRRPAGPQPRRPAAQPRRPAAAPASARPAPARSRPSQTATADGAGKTVGLLFDVTGRGDKSFNDAAAAGAGQGQGRLRHHGRGVDADRRRRQRPPRAHQGASSANDLIVAVGFLWGDATTASADGEPEPEVRHHRLRREHARRGPTTPRRTCARWCSPSSEGSFLVGAAAACASQSGKLGFIGGVENDLIKKFEAGFTAGAKDVNPDATVEVKYITQPPDFTGFNDPAKGKAIAKAHVRQRHRRRLRRRRRLGQGPVRGRRRRRARRRARCTPSASTPTSTPGRRPTCSPTSSPRR